MKENLACNQCKGIVCADTGDGKRFMTEIAKVHDGRYIEFPEPVSECPNRVPIEPKEHKFDELPP